MATTPLAYDPDKLRTAFTALKGKPRTPRVLDVLMGEREMVTEALRDNRNAKEVWEAFKVAGLTVSYSAFQRALKIFEQRASIPGGRRISRFLPTATTAPAKAGGPGATLPANTNPTLAQRRTALAAPSAAELEQRRIAGG